MKITLLFLILTQATWAYVFTRTASGAKLKWNIRTNTVPLVMNASNNQGLNESSVQAIFEDSISQWTDIDSIGITSSSGSISQLNNAQNRMYFSSDSSMFGTGVLAVTAINYDEVSGNIFNADILINDTGFFSSFTLNASNSTNNNPYLGDVISHEVGHFLGMNHSEVVGSTMVYNVFKGQHTIEYDDLTGLEDLYGTNSDYYSSLSGRVVGEDGVPVFGAHVQLMLDGKVYSAQFTDEDGNFDFKVNRTEGLKIFVSPMKSGSNISEYFRNVRSNFCNGKSFQPAFFSTCDKRDTGVAQRISADPYITGSRVNYLGDLTVRCSTPVDPEYLRTKFSSDLEDEFTAFDYSESRKNHGGFTGYFSASQVALGSSSTPDLLNLDLSNYDVAGNGVQLRLRSYTTQLGSAMGINLGYKQESAGSFTTVSPSLDSIGKYNTEQYVVIPLSTTTADNVFKLKVTPFTFSSTDKSEIFGNSEVLSNANNIYYLEFEIYDPYVDNSIVQVFHDYPYEDNAACLEGDVGTTSKAYRTLASTQLENPEQQGFACGTVDFDSHDDGSNGPFSLFVGLCLVLMLGFIREKLNDFFV